MSETIASALPADRLAVRDDHRGYVIVRERDDGRLAVSFRPGADGRLVAFAAAPSATALLSETLTEALGTQRKEHGVSADPAADSRWESLKAYLRDRIDAETPVMEGFRGEITGAASGGIVSACRFALAEMKRLENER